jgi:hypothetical protein
MKFGGFQGVGEERDERMAPGHAAEVAKGFGE